MTKSSGRKIQKHALNYRKQNFNKNDRNTGGDEKYRIKIKELFLHAYFEIIIIELAVLFHSLLFYVFGGDQIHLSVYRVTSLQVI